MKHAVIETGGKQYRVAEGDVIYVEKLDAEADATVNFDVLAVGKDDGFEIGGAATVTGKVIKTGKGKKVTVFTYRPKKGSARKLGHRQPYTKVTIEKIEA